VIKTPDLLIRGLSQAAIDAIDFEANTFRLSRNEYLKRSYEDQAKTRRLMTDDDWAYKSAYVALQHAPLEIRDLWRERDKDFQLIAEITKQSVESL